MSCSKIISGDLPELTNEIIQYFRNDFSTLYSCIFVNRLWCRLAIPLLWENPFLIPTQNYHCIEIYLSYLNEDGKAKINEYGINTNLLPSSTLFNYPSFIKYLEIYNISHSIENWVSTLVDQENLNKLVYWPLFLVEKNLMKLNKLVYRSLFEVFVGNEGNLHSLEIIMYINKNFENFDNTMELILQNPNFIYNIKNLKLHIYDISIPNIINIITFLKFLSSNCSSISTINFCINLSNIGNSSLVEKCLCQIIISQHNLKIITFGSDDILAIPFLSLKNSNCSNTLNTIIFQSIDFRNITAILREVFDHLDVLETIHIIYCLSLNSDFVQQIIKVTKPFKLRSLFISEILHIESIQLLIQKLGNTLENFGIGFMNDEYYEYNEFNEPKKQLLKSIMKYCTKISYFDPGIPDDNNIYLFIENNQQCINYLIIEVEEFNYCTVYNKFSFDVLENLGQVLPPKLEYLCLSLSFNAHYFEVFLKNSQNTFIKKLLITNIIQHDVHDNILFCIKEYIMKKNKVRYLAFCESNFLIYENDKELFSLEDEVDEFKLHNIIVKKYHDLHITANNLVHGYLQV
ncbi:hypothetical protein RclHR1_05220008 [Rhizophagus clarus]|uniref:F-box domain-containing protein n=1 Tax=Rhizophagus clarus TaxID=94130 RepID=A0A2Z6RN04_9GLOM|nr:hypothetical protein RclHR1_05220008 [Rhizophagus clarus]GES79146.1 hypothetical protein GLOIN_2v1875654 [Rhizophagus clarus]